ncbi:hypothetical protein NESM_000410700 [Novymonas esmeraldas]|uniref:Uncharacterized protein n=1 Tax=Novymonas esmeraldas TaxID=1808958 RepID=A0AAW0ENL6_9TRYP
MRGQTLVDVGAPPEPRSPRRSSRSPSEEPEAAKASPSRDAAMLTTSRSLSCAGDGGAAAPPVLARRLSSVAHLSYRDMDPYDVCRVDVDQLHELQEEQVAVARALQAALRTRPPSMHRAPGVENIAPGERLGQQRSPTPPPPSSSSSTTPASASRLAHRLRLLQRESATYAATRCVPSVEGLLNSFDAYWAWKRDNTQDADADPPPHTSAAASNTAAARSGTRPTLRQRYDAARRASDELSCFLRLHGEAVQALDAQLAVWSRHHANRDAADAPPVQQCSSEFEAYVDQLVEVAQTTQHIVQLLQSALQQLCRPAPTATALVRRGGLTAAANTASASNALRPQPHAMTVESAKAAKDHRDRRPPAQPDSETGVARTPQRRDVRRGDGVDAGAVPVGAGDRHSAWADAVSPPTPPSAVATASASPASFSASPPPRHAVQASSHRRRRSRRSPSPPSPAVPLDSSAERARSTASTHRRASPSTVGAVSLSPLTATRTAPPTLTAAVPVAHSQEGSSGGREQGNTAPHVAAAEGDEGECVVAAVTPVMTARRAGAGHASSPSPPSSPRTAGGEARSLLHELSASAHTTAADAETRGRRRQHRSSLQPRRSAAAAADDDDVHAASAAAAAAAAVVFVPPSSAPMPQQTASTVRDDVRSRDTKSSPSPPPRRPLLSSSMALSTAVSEESRVSLHSLSPSSLSAHAATGRSATRDGGGTADDSHECRGVGRAASIPNSVWPRLLHSAVPEHGPSGALAATPVVALECEGEGGGGPTAPVADSSFYTAARSVAATTAVAAEEVASPTPAHRASPPSPPPPLRTTQLTAEAGRQEGPRARAWERTLDPTPLPTLESLEVELEAVQEHLRADRPAPARRGSPASTATAGTTTTTRTGEGRAASAGVMHRAIDDQWRLTMAEESRAFHAEQRRSLRKVRRYVKHALHEVVEAVSAAASSQSSRASSRAHRDGAAPTATEEEPRVDDDAAAAAAPDTRGSPAAVPAPPVEAQDAVGPQTAVLRRDLADAEARAARLEQLTVQLKKRLWIAERAQQRPAAAAHSADGPPRRRLSLRDAFIYGRSGNVVGGGRADMQLNDDGDGDGDGAAGAVGAAAAAEEEALLYLVDRALGCGTSVRHSSDGLRRTPAAVSPRCVPPSPPTARSPDLKCFDDDDHDGLVRLGHHHRGPDASTSTSAAAAASSSSRATSRSRRRYERRASIFELLRSTAAATAAAPHLPASTGAKDEQDVVARLQSPSPAAPAAGAAERRRHRYDADARHGDAAALSHRTPAGLQSTSSNYYATISGGGGGGVASAAALRSPVSASALRAEHVLQSARVLLQRRSAALAAGHQHDHDGGARVGHVAAPGRWGEHAEQLDSHAAAAAAAAAAQQPARHLQLPSCESPPEGVYHGYDTSPCSAVAYSTGKLPRAVSLTGVAGAAPSTPPAAQAVRAALHRTLSSTSPSRHRVDSATSPIAKEEEGGGGGLGTAVRRSRVDRGSGDEGTGSFDISSREHSAPSAHTVDTRSTRGFRSPSSHTHARVGPRRSDGERAASPLPTMQPHRGASRRSISAASSDESAEQQLLDTLASQEATLTAALRELQEQQRQLSEKKREVSLFAQRAAPGVTHPRQTKGSAGADLSHLLKRFEAAASTLADRERRARESLRAVQRQRTALMRDDLL